jgi:hypothetical protein
MKENARDYLIPGTVIFRCMPWMFSTFFGTCFALLLRMTYKTKGLWRKVCIHSGSFYMNGPRQHFEASSSMVTQASEGTSNDYYNPKIINHTILPMIQSFINRLGEEAQQHQQSCGQMTLSLVVMMLKRIGSGVSPISPLSFLNSLLLSAVYTHLQVYTHLSDCTSNRTFIFGLTTTHIRPVHAGV